MHDCIYFSAEMYCAVIVDKKCTSSIIRWVIVWINYHVSLLVYFSRKLNSVCPLQEFVHLKRVKTQESKWLLLRIQWVLFKYRKWVRAISAIPFGLVVRIPGFHPGGPGSIPGVGSYLFLFFFLVSFFRPLPFLSLCHLFCRNVSCSLASM